MDRFIVVEQGFDKQDVEKQDSEQDKDKNENENEDQNFVEVPKLEVNEKELRLHLFNGTIITGQMSTDVISVATEFGTLDIPVEKVLKVVPGLDSYPHMLRDLDQLVKQLGDPEYKIRQTARRQLSTMGLKIKNELKRFGDGGNAERKKHLDEIRAEIDEQESDFDEFDDEPVRAYIRGDSVTTPDFTVVGKIQQAQFKLQSKYGELTVELADVQLIDRQFIAGQEIRRSISVSGNNFVHTNTKSTKIKVNKGDVVTLTASGQVTMTPWNKSSTPNGSSSSFGWYLPNQIEGGALCAKIGNSGKLVKIGTRKRFVAKSSGVLRLGVAIPTNYANKNYPGNYRVKIVVTHGQ